MMKFYLVHDRHGKKIAYQYNEYEADKKMGWKEVTEDEFYGVKKQPEKPAEEVTEPVSDDLSAQYEAKFGKKPHHKMKEETIRAALDDSAA